MLRTHLVQALVEIVTYIIPCGCGGRLEISNRQERLLSGNDFYYSCGKCGRFGHLIKEKR